MSAQDELNQWKALCKEGESDEEHEAHKDNLEAAYALFADRTESNPAAPGVTQIDAHVVVATDLPE